MDNFRKLPEPDDAEEERIVRHLVDKLGLRMADEYRHLLGQEITDAAHEQVRAQDRV